MASWELKTTKDCDFLVFFLHFYGQYYITECGTKTKQGIYRQKSCHESSSKCREKERKTKVKGMATKSF